MAQKDLTVPEVLKDPMIRLMMRADRVKVRTMKTLLVDAAEKQKERFCPMEDQQVPVPAPAEGHLRAH